MQKSSSKSDNYIPTDIFVRVRPFASSGYHGKTAVAADKGVKVSSENKRIENFTENDITIKDEGTLKSTKFDYPKLIISPEINQNDSFKKLEIPEKINYFMDGHNCTAIAYGQTGSGKTHTMFGPPSLGDEINKLDLDKVDLTEENSFPENWGLFARAILTCLSQTKKPSKLENCKFKFTATVIELYMMEVFDLLNNKSKVPTSKFGGGEFDFGGVTEIPIDGIEDVAKLAKTVMNERRASITNVNDSSSRSHCIATLNLICIKGSGDKKEVRRSTFTG